MTSNQKVCELGEENHQQGRGRDKREVVCKSQDCDEEVAKWRGLDRRNR